MSERFCAFWAIKDDRTGTPVTGRSYKLHLASGPSDADKTDVLGWTRVIYSAKQETVYLTLYEQDTITIE